MDFDVSLLGRSPLGARKGVRRPPWGRNVRQTSGKTQFVEVGGALWRRARRAKHPRRGPARRDERRFREGTTGEGALLHHCIEV